MAATWGAMPADSESSISDSIRRAGREGPLVQQETGFQSWYVSERLCLDRESNETRRRYTDGYLRQGNRASSGPVPGGGMGMGPERPTKHRNPPQSNGGH